MQVQLAELIDTLDREFWESDLQAALEEIREEVHAHMDITEDLTNKARGSSKSFLTVANGQNYCFVCLFFVCLLLQFPWEGQNHPSVISCHCFSLFDKAVIIIETLPYHKAAAC